MAQPSSLAKVALRGSSWQVSKPLVLVCVESGGTELTGFALSWVVLLEFSMHPLRKMVITRVGTSLSFPLPLPVSHLRRCLVAIIFYSPSALQYFSLGVINMMADWVILTAHPLVHTLIPIILLELLRHRSSNVCQ
jgi:hypothetical protein